jgi:hypothetical protein
MRTSTFRALALFLLAGALPAALTGCTIVAPGGPDAGVKTKVVVLPKIPRPDALPPPKPLQASVLYVANLQRAVAAGAQNANLANQYASVITGLAAYWQSVNLQIANMGLISTYADQYGPRLLLGRSSTAGTPPSSLALLALLAQEADAGVTNYQNLLPLLAPTLGNIDDSDLSTALLLLAGSGNFDGDGETSEAKNLIEFGRGLNAASLPASAGGIDRSAFFAVPHDLFIIVYLQPLPRRCALGTSACDVDGRSPTDIFTETDSDGNATWLSFSSGGIRPEQVVHLSIATSEGESQAAFETRCKAVAGFPTSILDVIEPSSNAFFTPLMSALNAANAGTGHSGDFCTLIGKDGTKALDDLANGVAALAMSH